MQLQLIKGRFSPDEAVQLLTRMTQEKIRFHESKVGSTCTEEDIKMREKRIRELQNELHEIKSYLRSKTGPVQVHAHIEIE